MQPAIHHLIAGLLRPLADGMRAQADGGSGEGWLSRILSSRFDVPPELQELWADRLCWLLGGVIIGLLLLLLGMLIFAWWRRQRRRQRSIIHIPGENGSYNLMPRAVNDFVFYSLDEFRQVTIRHVYVVGLRSGYLIRIDVALAPYTNFRVTKEQMANKVKEDLIDLMGVTSPLEVEINVARNDANTRPAPEDS